MMNHQRLAIRFVLILALVVGFMVFLGPTQATASTSSCTAPWGSLKKQAESTRTVPSRFVNLRSGRHECFDRLVIDFDGPVGTSYTVEYVDQLVEDGSGNVIPLRGGASVNIYVGAPAHDDDYVPTFVPPDKFEAVNVSGHDTFRQVVFLSTYEGQTQVGLGVRARLPFRVFTLAGPGDGSRLVIDVAHSWYTQKTVQLYFNTGDVVDCTEVTPFARGADGVKAPIRFTLDQLVAGPTETEMNAGASSQFSSATAGSVRSINLRSDGMLIVDFKDIRSLIPNASSSCGSGQLMSSLNSTLFQFPAVKRVRYQFEGSCDTFTEFIQQDCEFNR